MEPAWRDPDDETIQVDLTTADRLKKFIAESNIVSGSQYSARLRAFYSSMHQPTWTQPSPSLDKKSLSGLLSTSKSILSQKSHRLLDGSIDISQLSNLNAESQSKSAVTAVEFSEGIALTAGLDKKLRVFRVGETGSPCESVAYFKDLPINSAHFLPGSVYVSGKRPFYYIFDLETSKIRRIPVILGLEKVSLERMVVAEGGKQIVFLTDGGEIPFVSTMSQKVVFQLKMNAPCLCAAPLSDTLFLTAGADGDLYTWDLRTRRCLRRFPDTGNITVTALAVSQRLIATGSTSGVVNVYDRDGEGFNNEHPEPTKSLMNLTTTIDGLTFDDSGELLAMWTRWKRGGVRLVHCQTTSVYGNWPEARGATVQFPTALSFSEGSKYLSVGNDEGNALLYKLNHYAGD